MKTKRPKLRHYSISVPIYFDEMVGRNEPMDYVHFAPFCNKKYYKIIKSEFMCFDEGKNANVYYFTFEKLQNLKSYYNE